MTIRSIAACLAAVLFVSAALAAPPAARGADATKIAVANPAKIFNEMQETKDLKQKMESDRKIIEATDNEKKTKLKDLQAARDQLRSDSPQFQEKNQELMKFAIEYEVWTKVQQADLQRNQKQQMKSLFDKIQSAVTEVAKEKGVDLVIAEQRPELPDNLEQVNVEQLRLLINQRNILFEDPKADLSNDVIALLDSKYKAGGK